MECFNHQNQPAVGVCSVCSKGVCRTCMTEVGARLSCNTDLCKSRVMVLGKMFSAYPKNRKWLGYFYILIGLLFIALMILSALFAKNPNLILNMLYLLLGIVAIYLGARFIKEGRNKN